MNAKRTLVVGASPKPERYAYKAVARLAEAGHEPIALGIRPGKILNHDIITERKAFENIHSISLYVGPARQPEYYDYLLSLNPKRIIFNPGTENPEFMQLAESKGIEVEEACTLVMLSLGVF